MAGYIKTRSIYPILIPDHTSLDVLIFSLHQGATNACSVFACANALLVSQRLQGSGIGFSALDLYKELLAQKYNEYDPRKSVSVPAVLNLMKEKMLIKKWRLIQNTPEDYKIKLVQGYPIIAIIQSPKRSHAVCVYGYDKEVFSVYDSNKKDGRDILPPFTDIKKSYIIHLS